MLSLRIDGELLDRLRSHAARRGMSVQDYVVRTLIREDFDERFQTAVDETERFYGESDGAGGETDDAAAVPPRHHARPGAGIA